MIDQLDIQYCCFQDCYGKNGLYGSAVFTASNKTVLLYASTVDCPGFENDDFRSEGAQFDIQANTVDSQYVNATGGNSKYCGGIEYRNAIGGSFKFQTISEMKCMFSIAYTDIAQNSLELSTSNIYNITLHNLHKTEKVYPGLIHVRVLDLQNNNNYEFKIENFCFRDNDFGDDENARIISRGYKDESIMKIIVILTKCSYDVDHSYVEYSIGDNYRTTINCNFIDEPTLNDIPQLDLGKCHGQVQTPKPIAPTNPFSFSNYFSSSEGFSKTDYFSESSDFSKSDNFEKTKEFSKSNDFSKSDAFAKTDEFSLSEAFAKTDEFSKSNVFTKSDDFGKTKGFTKSKKFTKSNQFSKSDDFTKSDAFEKSSEFSKSNYFTKSKNFEQTKEFTKSSIFSKSNVFTKSDLFTNSNEFSLSNSFTLLAVPIAPDSRKGNNKNVGMVAGIVAAIVALLVIAIIVMIYLKKRKTFDADEEIETIDDNVQSINSVNPIYDNNGEDDPFKEDFV